MITIVDLPGLTGGDSVYQYAQGKIDLDVPEKKVMTPVRGITLEGKSDYHVYCGNKMAVEECILSRTAKDGAGLLLVADKFMVPNSDTVEGVMLFADGTKGEVVMLSITSGSVVVDLKGTKFRLSCDGDIESFNEGDDTLTEFSVDALRGIAKGFLDNGGNSYVTPVDNVETMFAYSIVKNGPLEIESVRNFKGGVLISNEGTVEHLSLWPWSAMTKDSRVRYLMTSRILRFRPSKEQAEELAGIDSVEDMQQRLSDFEEESRRHAAEYIAREEAAKAEKKAKSGRKPKKADPEDDDSEAGERIAGGAVKKADEDERDAMSAFLGLLTSGGAGADEE